MSSLLVVVAYDIADDRRREGVSAALAGVGVRVQYSVFEVELDKQAALESLAVRLRGLIDHDEDQIRVYTIASSEGSATLILGRRRLEERSDYWII